MSLFHHYEIWAEGPDDPTFRPFRIARYAWHDEAQVHAKHLRMTLQAERLINAATTTMDRVPGIHPFHIGYLLLPCAALAAMLLNPTLARVVVTAALLLIMGVAVHTGYAWQRADRAAYRAASAQRWPSH